MKAAILAVGDELLSPGRSETNSVFLTDELAALGIPVVFRGVLGDDEAVLARTMRHVLEQAKADVLFVSGGLGPTSDDRTRDAMLRAFELEARVDPDVLQTVRSRFERRGIEMPSVNERQALVPVGGEVLPNALGTAPGVWFRTGSGKLVVLLPGPPRELRPMFHREIHPRLAGETSRALSFDVMKLLVAGVPESSVEQAIGDLYRDTENPITTILATAGEVEIRLTASGETSEAARRSNLALSTKIRSVLGRAIFSETGERLEDVVGRLLHDAGLTLATAESVTGGLIAHRITEVPGSSGYFEQGFVTYNNASKNELLGVSLELLGSVGAVSEEVARAMAFGARERASSDLAVAVTGIAGPTGATATKPVGLVYIGLAFAGGSTVERFSLPGDRSYVKAWTAQLALNLVRLHLLRDAG